MRISPYKDSYKPSHSSSSSSSRENTPLLQLRHQSRYVPYVSATSAATSAATALNTKLHQYPDSKCYINTFYSTFFLSVLCVTLSQDMQHVAQKMDDLKNAKIMELQSALNNLKKGFGVREKSLEKTVAEHQKALAAMNLSHQRTRYTLQYVVLYYSLPLASGWRVLHDTTTTLRCY